MKTKLPLQVRRDGQDLIISSPHWTVTHSLSAGGAIVSMRVRHGTDANLLRAPIGASVNVWRECQAQSATYQVDEQPGRVTLTVRGRLSDAFGQPGPVEYTHRYEYTPYLTRHNLTLTFLDTVRVHTVRALEMAFSGGLSTFSYGSTDYDKVKPRYQHIIGPHYDDLWAALPDQTGPVWEDRRRPWQVTLLAPGVEGIQWCGDSREYAWNTVCGTSNAGRFGLIREREGARVDLCPIDDPTETVSIAAGATLEFGWYLILPNVPEMGHRRYYEVVIGTSPLPEEAQLQAWAAKGVNLLRIHQDADYQGQTEDYWHDGVYPPYSPAKMRELDRFIGACHRLGMRSVPYFCGWILNTLAPSFTEHVREWYVPSRPNGQLRFHPSPGAGTFGAFVCPDSGWGAFLDGYIRKCVDELGFDGYYLDYGSPGPCYHVGHLPGAHNGIDALASMLIRHREWLGDDRLLIVHNGGTCMWLLHQNVADQVVTLEEGKRGGGPLATIDDYPPYIAYMPATSVSLVPNVFYTEPGEPPRLRLYRGIAHAALLGALPYTYSFHEPSAWNYAAWRDAVDDPRGLYALYERYAAHDWSAYRFYNLHTQAARTGDPAVGAALYARPGEAVGVVGNLTDQPAAAGQVEIDPHIQQRYQLAAGARYPSLAPYELQLIAIRNTTSQA